MGYPSNPVNLPHIKTLTYSIFSNSISPRESHYNSQNFHIHHIKTCIKLFEFCQSEYVYMSLEKIFVSEIENIEFLFLLMKRKSKNYGLFLIGIVLQNDILNFFISGFVSRKLSEI